jgi:acyl carrier protein
MDKDIHDRLVTTFQSVFDDADIRVTRDTVADDVEGWDSLTHINLIVAIEKEFRVRFTTSEITALTNVGDLADLITRKLAC